uniref:Inter-alpha-trypsin inhibitor heavy chain H2-like n=1 Tax=Sinocyclocheilus rhinocerous TaxID=307959 RepID=A0A673I832_9TELE
SYDAISIFPFSLECYKLLGNDITVKSYKVESRITSRFTHTTVKSSVVNSGPNAQSIGFNVEIPKRAFINNFTMNVNGITFTGSVKEKSVARNLYAQARARGKAAGIVRTNSQAMETFRTEVHVPPGSKVEFELHYQGMMQRKLGVYQHTLHLQPGRLVPLLQVDVYIFEPKGIKFVTASNTLGEQFSDLTKITHTKEKAHLVFKPTLQQQRKCENCTESAVDGVFTVTYDVERESNAGELQVSDGHFVQFFAPSDLSPLSKNIVFVIDVSGSMWGLKMKQVWMCLLKVSFETFLENGLSLTLYLTPGTNINEALLRAVQMLLRASNHGLIDPRSVSMIILVSDGDPTVGEIKLSTIQKNVKRVMREEFSLYSLGIGFDVDFDFLERIAMDNRGYMNISFLRFPLIVLIYFASVDFLSCSSLAPTANKKRRITQRIMALAVEHQFVTPFTAMLVEGHDQGGAERLIADSPRDSKHGCCSTTAPLSGPRPVQQLLYAKPQWIQPTYAPNQEAIGTLESTIITSVDNDPHFIIHLPKSNMDICFNIDSKPGHILNLISDPGTGVTINGQLVGSKKMKNNKIDTYFGTFIIGLSISFFIYTITHLLIYAKLLLIRMRVTIVKEEHVTVTVDGKISVMVLLHRVWKKHPVQVDFLGVYMSSDNKYSTRVHGLIGQFAQEPEVKVYGVHEGADPKKKEATMEVKGNKVAVTRGWQKDYRRNKKRGSDVYCWFIHNSGKGFIDGSYTSYILPQLDSFLTAI